MKYRFGFMVNKGYLELQPYEVFHIKHRVEGWHLKIFYNMITLTILTLLITLLYNSYIIIKYKKIPQSLSETSYLLGGNKRYLFTGYCFIISFCLLPVLFTITNNFLFLPFIFCGGLLFAGCSPLFKSGLDKPIHYICSYIAFAAYIFYMIFCMG